MTDQCDNCFFGRIFKGYLACLRKSPMPLGQSSANNKGILPAQVPADYWCGDYSRSDPQVYGNINLLFGTATLDFGEVPTGDATVAVTGQNSVISSSQIQIWIQDDPIANQMIRLTPINTVPGVGFSIRADSVGALVSGTLPVNWSYKNG